MSAPDPEIPYIDAEKIGRLFTWPGCPCCQPIKDLQLRGRDELKQELRVTLSCIRRGLLSAYQLVLQLLTIGHSHGDLDRAQGGEEGFVGHSHSPCVARAVTRYVTGAILAALGGLQRKAWVRRAAPLARPSGTTNAVGGDA